ncbi:Alcohol dehydrogenase GroES-like domain-containing protein [Duganella sp. CF517]|uniref:NAD(P)-dependent alcohol dehydrogenase n=1 Tax=Duganella sp. CF517 TaxID=1881038 RepID=UPI0008B7D1BA|nr:NAD(P)-dependent alcohol dehydrogenase [Duganella sp. CF517]SEN57302.1 Alcohol dehydrogenase GroES-like domain-containing protein [Duganella sp. CF517]
MSTMKRLQYHQYGGPELMRLEHFDLDTPGRGEVAVRVQFAAINPIDWKLRQGVMKMMTGQKFPRAMGFDFSGTVIAVGPEVARLQPGDAVFGLARFKESGALGQALVTNAKFVAKKPDGVSFADAACLGTPGMTTWGSLIDKAHHPRFHRHATLHRRLVRVAGRLPHVPRRARREGGLPRRALRGQPPAIGQGMAYPGQAALPPLRLRLTTPAAAPTARHPGRAARAHRASATARTRGCIPG